MLELIFSESFARDVLSYAIPIMFAALASLISVKAGISAINIEGAMSCGAVAGALVSHFTGSWVLGLMSAIAGGMGMMALLWCSALKLHSDSFLSGIALNTLADGLCLLVVKGILEGRTDTSTAPSAMVPTLRIPLLADIPVIGPIFFCQNGLFYILILCVILMILLLKKTRLGTHIKAVGYHCEAAQSLGINAAGTRLKALLLCGALAGLGGAYLSMASLGYFSDGMVSGRGFIGIAAESMGGGMPIRTLLYSLLFGAVDCFAVSSQTVLTLPYELLNTLPYLMTLLAMIIYAAAEKKKKEKD